MAARNQIGLATVITLVALRLGIGWHFFKEGAKKFQDDNFTSVYFLQQATGPVAGLYQRLIPDVYGRLRLSAKIAKDEWGAYRIQASRHFGFDAAQNEQSTKVLEAWEQRLDWYFADNGQAIKDYFNELARLHEAKSDTSTRDVAFARQRIASKERQLSDQLNGWTAELRSMRQRYENELGGLATAEQLRRGRLPMPDPTRPWSDTVVKYLLISVGACLILGLVTRIASVAGALFLGSVMLSQPPWVPDAQTSFFYYQLVELCSLLLLAATGAGRFLGLDFFIHSMRMRYRPPTLKGIRDEPDA